MVLCTCAAPDSGLIQALTSLSKFDNIVVVAERVSNVSVRDAVFAPEAVIGSMDEEKKRDMAPELLITIGGAPISAGLKKISQAILSCPTLEFGLHAGGYRLL